MRAIVLLPVCLCLIAATAPTSPPASLPAPPPPPAEETPVDPVPPHIAQLNLPPPAQSRGPVEELPGAQAQPTPEAGDGIQRCSGSDGSAVFTDRRCEDVGASPYIAPLTGNATTRVYVRSCARSREALLDGLRDALETQDANRVASYFHWTGMGNSAAYAVMDRLQKFSERPLMDIRLETSAERLQPAYGPPLGWSPSLPPLEVAPIPPPPRPNLIRVDQARGYKDPASEVTYLHVLANAGCWWVRF